MNSPITRCGYVALIGRPNSGKSTFLNTLIEEDVSAVSNLPQMTQKIIRGIYSTETTQIVFLDTPGLHESTKEMNVAINDSALK